METQTKTDQKQQSPSTKNEKPVMEKAVKSESVPANQKLDRLPPGLTM